MEFVCIEAKTFMEMNEALEAVAKKMCETCGSCVSGMDDWIDNQEACMLMDISPRKMLQLRRSRDGNFIWANCSHNKIWCF